MAWDGTTLTIGFAQSGRPGEHEVFFPGPAPKIVCGAEQVPSSHVIVDAATSTYTIGCDGGQLTLTRP
jgi:hypothetical protein